MLAELPDHAGSSADGPREHLADGRPAGTPAGGASPTQRVGTVSAALVGRFNARQPPLRVSAR
jgi:hypothetical protein